MASTSVGVGADTPQRSRFFVPGTGWAFIGVLVFSFTLIATRFAIRGIDPSVVGTGRTVGAGGIAIVALLMARPTIPPRSAWLPLVFVALGCGIGFGYLTSLALRTESAAHGAVVIALLPVMTALVATLRGHEHPGRTFWIGSIVGTAIVIAYVVIRGGGHVSGADALLLLAVIAAAVGYAEGGRLARTMPGWQVIAWGLVICLPVAIPATAIALAVSPPIVAGNGSVLGFLYLCVMSMFVGFFAWYRGLAQAGVARASQVQLLQPLLTVVWAAWLLHEDVGWATIGTAVLVVVCIGITQRARVNDGLSTGVGPAG